MAEYVRATKAELPTDGSVPVGSKAWITIGDLIYEWDGDSWVLKSIRGAALVASDLMQGNIAGQRIIAVHRREVNPVDATAETIDFSATPVAGILLTLVPKTAGTAQLLGSMTYTAGFPNDATRDAWLTAGQSLGADINRDVLSVNNSVLLTFDGATVNNVGVKREAGTEDMICIVTGFKV